MRISPKILGLNVGVFETIFEQSKIVLRIGFGPETDVFGVLLCVLVFGTAFGPSWKR